MLRPIYLARRSGPHAFLWCWKKNKIENQYSTHYGRARSFIFAILNGRLIATRRPIACTLSPYFDLDIECADVITSSCLCRFISTNIKDKASKLHTNFLVIKFNMQNVICNFLRKIRARASRISKPLYIQHGRMARDSLNSVNISQEHRYLPVNPHHNQSWYKDSYVFCFRKSRMRYENLGVNRDI